MDNPTIKDVLNNDRTQATLKSAQQYCDFIESVLIKPYEQEKFIDLLHGHLADLYAKSINLPEIELITEDVHAENETGETDPDLFKKLSEILGIYADYSKSFDPTIIEDQENYSQGWLTDDLADIYLDLTRALSSINKGTDADIQIGLWELKFLFGVHWGDHLIDALRFLHYLKYWHFAKQVK